MERVSIRPIRDWCLLATTLLGGACGREAASIRLLRSGAAEQDSKAGCTTCLDTVALSQVGLELSSVTGLDADSKGNAYVADWQSRTITMLAPSGAKLKTVGRNGQGPGEFQGLSNIQVLRGDTLLAYDVQLARITLFEPSEQRVVRTISILASGAGHPMSILSDGLNGYVATYEPTFRAGAPGDSDLVRRVQVKLLTQSGMVRLDSFASVAAGEQLVLRTATAVAVQRNPFGRSALVQVQGGSVFTATSDTAVVHIRRLDGRASTSIAMAFLPKRIPSEALRDTLEVTPLRFRSALSSVAPAFWPAIEGFVVGEPNQLWLGLMVDPGHTVRWKMIDPNGIVGDSFDMAAGVSLRRIRDGLGYAVVRDADDVPRVLVVRVPQTAR